MSFAERISYAAFVNNQAHIESEWDTNFGDRKIELVFIGQHLDVDCITQQLEECLVADDELTQWKTGNLDTTDNWPIPKYQNL